MTTTATVAGDSTAAKEGKPLAKSVYISRADQICAEGTLEIAQESQERFEAEPESTAEVEEFSTEVVAPALAEQVRELRALAPPEGDEEEVDAIYDAVEDGIRQLEKRPEIILQADVGGAFDQANRLAQAYGFEQCGES